MTLPLRFKPHCLKQDAAIDCQKRILVLATGTQFGKTTVGAYRMKIKNHEFTNKDDHFIITSPNYKTMMQSTLLPYLDIMRGLGKYNKMDQMFEINRGGRVFFRTETDPDSIVGITNVRHIWGDEAGKYRLYFWENMQARADFMGASIDLTTSPYSRNWVFKELVRPALGGHRSDVELIQAASWENPYHFLNDPIKRREKQATMDPRRFAMLYGGEWGSMVGLVYDCFDEIENQCDAFTLPHGTRYYAGVDWGFTDPFVIKVRAITPDGKHFGISEFYKSGMQPQQCVEIAVQKAKVFGLTCFYCDPSQPGMISQLASELHKSNIKCGVTAANNDIDMGVGVHYELLKTRRLKYFKFQNEYTLDEMDTYHYPEPVDLGPDQSSKNMKPVGQNDHTMDAERYLSIMTYRTGQKLTPKMPNDGPKQETEEQRYKRLTKKKNYSSESWD